MNRTGHELIANWYSALREADRAAAVTLSNNNIRTQKQPNNAKAKHVGA
jgi:hypothetical protein